MCTPSPKTSSRHSRMTPGWSIPLLATRHLFKLKMRSQDKMALLTASLQNFQQKSLKRFSAKNQISIGPLPELRLAYGSLEVLFQILPMPTMNVTKWMRMSRNWWESTTSTLRTSSPAFTPSPQFCLLLKLLRQKSRNSLMSTEAERTPLRSPRSSSKTILTFSHRSENQEWI